MSVILPESGNSPPRASGAAIQVGVVACPATFTGPAVCVASDRGVACGEGAERQGVTGKPSSRARLAAAVSSTSDRRVGRTSLPDGLARVSLMISYLPVKLLQDPAPELTNLLAGPSTRRELSDAQSCPERVLMVVSLSDEGQREYPKRIERGCSFTQSATSRRRLIEDEGESAVQPPDSDQRRYCSFDVGWARARRDQAKIGVGNGAH